jgi:hypothetical protein
MIPTTPEPVVPTTIREALAAGAVAGTPLTAPLSPKSGPIPGKPGDLVVGVLKGFWESPTIIALRRAVGTAIGLALMAISGQVMAANGDLSQVNWDTTQKIAIAAGAFSLASAYAAWWKKRDNDPVK